MKKIKLVFVCIVLAALLTFCIVVNNTNNYIKKDASFNVLLEAKGTMGYQDVQWIGSGVIIDKEGLIVTARHCVEGATEIRITLQNGKSYYAIGWMEDKDSDIALIKINVKFKDVPKIGNSNVLKQGDNIYEIGNPLGIYENKVAKGKVEKNNFKRMAIHNDSEYILADIKIKEGCSGGGAYYKHELIGIVSLGGTNIAFFIPSENVTRLLKQYKLLGVMEDFPKT